MLERAALPTFLALIVIAGCVGFAPGDAETIETTETTTTDIPRTTESSPETTVEAPPPTDCGDVSVAFYAVGGDVQERMWDPDVVRIGYTIPPDTSLFFVAYEGEGRENETVLGVERDWNGGEYPVAADGAPVGLDAPLSGEHTISVVVHADGDGDGEFDRTEDPACRTGGEVVRAGPATFDFDEFAEATTDG